MRVTKCDLCKKIIKGEPVIAGTGFFPKPNYVKNAASQLKTFLKNINL